MNAVNHEHPDRAVLEAFGVGQLDPARAVVVEQHLADCDVCCDAVQMAPDDTLVSQLREAVTLLPYPASVGATPAGHETVGHPSTTDGVPIEAPSDLARHPRYRLMKLLGRGGMGAVFQAEHGVMRRLVALKVINLEYTSNPAAVERFQREIRAAAQLHHPNIVAAYDAEQAGDAHFLVMEYIDGVSLDRLVAEKGPLPVAEACEYVQQAARGLQHAHERGMVHRDVKPHNLIRGGDGVVRVLDFGLASVVECGEGPLTGPNVVMGTPDYIAPEQAEDTHTADARSDIYSLGCTLYHLLVGRPPFTHASTLLKLVAHRAEAPASVRAARPDIPEELAGVLGRMMAKVPADRCQTAAEVAAALAPFATGTMRPKPRPKSRRRVFIAAAVAALCLAGLAAAVAAVVIRIQTDQGEVTIQTDDPNIEVVVTKAGNLVRIVDPQSKQSWELDPKNFTLSMADQPDGLTIELDGKKPLTLRRKGVQLVTITRGPVEMEEKVGEIRRFEGHIGSVRAVAYSPDGRFVISGGGYPTGDRTIRLWDVATGKEVRRFASRTQSWVNSVTFSPDGRRAASGLTDQTARLWDVDTGHEVRKFEGHVSEVFQVAFSPNGRQVLSGGMDGTMRLWDADTGKEVHRFEGHMRWVVSVAFSPDGRRIASGGNGDGPIRLWDVETGKQLKRFEGRGEEGAVVAYSPDGRFLLSGGADKTVRLWDVETGKELRSFVGHTGGVNSVAFSPDGRRALSGGQDTRLRLWDVETGKELCCFRGHTDAIWSVAFSPSGSYGLSGSQDQTVRLWRLPDPPADKPNNAP